MAAPTRLVARPGLAPYGACGAMTVTVDARPLLRFVVRVEVSGARDFPEHELCRKLRVGVTFAVDVVRNRVAFVAGDAGVRIARGEVNRMRADTGIAGCGLVSEVEGRRSRRERIARAL